MYRMYIVYIVYSVYNMYIMYKIADFRRHMRQAFNDAEQGHEVTIERHGRLFQLVSLVDKPLSGHSFESVLGELAKPIKKVEPRKSVVSFPTVEASKFCDHGAGKGLCKIKGCKYYQFK